MSMAIIPKLNPNPVDVNYSQQIQTNVSIRFIMGDSASASGQDKTGMPLPGKTIFANYCFQSPIMNTQINRAPQIFAGENIQILPTTTYPQDQAQQLWDTYISPYSNGATIDLNTRIVTVPYP